MSRFTICIAQRETNIHSRCFEDVAKALADALRQLGHEVVDFANPGRMIMFGAGHVRDDAGKMPADAIFFNAEQVSAVDNPAALLSSFEQYRNRVVWDYAQSNVDALKRLGIERAVLCPVGYVPSMTKIEPVEEDIEVLFYGSISPRRKEIFDALVEAGINLVVIPPGQPCYGEERDRIIARAKIVLNLHFYERPVFEIFRVSHLLANKKCVVNEAGSQDAALETFAECATVNAARDQIVKTCLYLLHDDRVRRAAASRGFFEFSKTSFVENVRLALEQSEV